MIGSAPHLLCGCIYGLSNGSLCSWQPYIESQHLRQIPYQICQLDLRLRCLIGMYGLYFSLVTCRVCKYLQIMMSKTLRYPRTSQVAALP